MIAELPPELGQRLTALEEDAPAVAYALRRTADALRGDGELRIASLTLVLEEFTERCRACESALTAVVAQCGVPRAEGHRLGSVLSQRRAWNWLTTTAVARQMLQSAERLQSVDDAVDLEAVRRMTRNLKDSLAEATLAENVPPELHSEVADQHPLAALVRLVTQREALADGAWDECHTRVRNAFGPQLAIAAARGRLTCS